MATVAALPPSLEQKLADLAGRIRRLQLLRGVGLLACVSLGLAGGVMLAESQLSLGPVPRAALLLLWGGTTLWAAVRFVVRPLRYPLDRAALAATVEEAYPKLGERLTTAVELADGQGDHNGARNLVMLLVREAELKTRAVDFPRVVSPHAAEYAGIGAVAALLVLVAPALFIGDRYLDIGRRFLAPWTAAPLGFNVAATPGDAVVGRGRPVEFRATLHRLTDAATLPATARLVVTAGGKKPVKLQMAAAGGDAFAFRFDSVTEPFSYYVEAGDGRTPTHTVTPADPVQLADGSPAITVTPPAYAKAVEPQALSGSQDFAAIEYSRVVWQWTFDRPAKEAYLLVTAAAEGEPASPTDATASRINQPLGDDGKSFRYELLPSALRNAYRLVIVGDHGLRTETPAHTLTVAADRAPVFNRVHGLPTEIRKVTMADRVAVECTVTDDVGVESLDLEYQVNEGAVQREAIALRDAGRATLDAKYSFSLQGKVKDGDTVLIRLAARDGRRIPEMRLEPNVAYYPANDQWAVVKVSAAAKPLAEQEIAAKEEQFEKRLKAIIAEVDRERRLQTIAKNADARTESDKGLNTLREVHAATTKLLDRLTADTGATPGYAKLAEGLQAVGEGEMRKADAGMQQADRKTGTARKEQLVLVDNDLHDARKKLDELLQLSQKLAQAKLEQAKLESLAQKQQELADKAAEKPDDAAKLAKQEKELADELKKLAENSQELKQAMQQANAAKAQELADQAQKVADEQKALNEQAQQADTSERAQKLSDLAKKQQELAAEAKTLAEESKTNAQVARAAPLQPEPAQKAADALKQGDADTAGKQQDQMARDLDRLGDKLGKQIEQARDPREMAAQLARQQEANRQQSEKSKDDAAKKEAVKAQQQAIRDAARQMAVPETNAKAQQAKAEAESKLAAVDEAMERGDQAQVERRMGRAKDALNDLAAALPTPDERKAKARDEVAKLKAMQDAVARDAAKPDAAKKQAEIADRLGKLDAPGQEQRQQKAAEAAATAKVDLDGKTADVPASQAAAQRTLERLQQALNGQKTDDEKAMELARRQEALANEAQTQADAGNKPSTAQAKEMKRRQQQVAQEAAALNAPEAPLAKDAAATAAQKAADTPGSKPEAVAEQAADAAKKLKELARQMAGESDAAKADRLAKQQEAAAQQPAAAPNAEQRQAMEKVAKELGQVRAGDAAAEEKKAAQDAAGKLAKAPAGEKPQAEAQANAAQAMRKLADKLKDQAPQQAANPMQPQANPAAAQQAQQAKELAQKQRELREQVKQAMQAPAQQTPADAQVAKAMADKQEQLQQQANDVGKQLEQLAKDSQSQPGQPSARDAANSAQASQQAMKNAQAQSPGNQPAAQANRQQAQQQMQRAADQAKQSAQANAGTQPPQPNPTGEALQQAQQAMQQAQQQLGQNKPGEGQQSMQNAAQQLAQAAQGMSPSQGDKPPEVGDPNQGGGDSKGTPDTTKFAQELQKHAGKPWGELPGELRTKIIQEVKSQYGDDYARIIKLYFEQIADRKPAAGAKP